MPYGWDKQFEVRDMRNGEWYWVQKEVLVSNKINASDKLVYSALAYYSNQKNQACFPSYTAICKLVNLHRNTVIKSIKALINNKFISKQQNDGKVNFYNLLKVTSTNFVPVPKENHHQSKLEPGTSPKENHEQELIEQELLNNNVNNSYRTKIKQISDWAFGRALGTPSCTRDQFE